MKLTQTAKRLETNAQVQSQNFGIGDASVVIEILRNRLYRHKIRTLVQEYISNGRDAMREAKSKGKLEVTIPNNLSPVFKVRDFGLGVDPERMANVFIMYGASTKRDSNTQTGGFGIGAKSAWAYTDAFSIITFIDGVQRTYVAHTGANNNGRLDFLGEAKTSEPNGTEIQIPVSPQDIKEFRNSAFRACHFWHKSEKPKFKGITEEFASERDEGDFTGALEIAKNQSIPDYVVDQYRRGVIIVVDGIPYLAESNLVDKVKGLKLLTEMCLGRMILHVDNGVVEVSASREELSDSKRTVDGLHEVAINAHKELKQKITDAFAVAKTPFKYLTVYMSLSGKYNLSDYNAIGDFKIEGGQIASELFNNVLVNKCSLFNDKLIKTDLNRETRRSRYYGRKGIESQEFNSLFYYDSSESKVVTHYRIRAYLESNHNIVVFQKLDSDAGQFDKLVKSLGIKDLKTIAYTKPIRQPREIVRIEREKKSFCVHKFDSYGRNTEFITLHDNAQKWLYIDAKSKYDKHEMRDLNDYLEKFTDFKICAISKDAVKRVQGDENFSKLSDFLKAYKASKDDIVSLKYEAAVNKQMLDNLKRAKGIKDKFFSKMLEEYAAFDSCKGYAPKLLKAVIGKLDEIEDFKIDDKKLNKMIDDTYPLLHNINWYNKIKIDEIVSYINSK